MTVTDVEALNRAIELVKQIPGPRIHQNMQGSNAHHAALQAAVRALTVLRDELQSSRER